jgi:hypothetical protein
MPSIDGLAHTALQDDAANNPALTEHVSAIRALGRRAVDDIIEIGCRLTECRRIVGHGNWSSWLNLKFGWSGDTALNFMRVHEMAKSRNFRDLGLSVSALYLLSAPSTSDEARTEILERAEAGETIPVKEVKRSVRRKKTDASACDQPGAAAFAERIVSGGHGRALGGDVGDQEIAAAAAAATRAKHTIVNGTAALVVIEEIPTTEKPVIEIDHGVAELTAAWTKASPAEKTALLDSLGRVGLCKFMSPALRKEIESHVRTERNGGDPDPNSTITRMLQAAASHVLVADAPNTSPVVAASNITAAVEMLRGVNRKLHSAGCGVHSLVAWISSSTKVGSAKPKRRAA